MTGMTRKIDSGSPPARLRVEALQRVNARTSFTRMTNMRNNSLTVSQTTDFLVKPR